MKTQLKITLLLALAAVLLLAFTSLTHAGAEETPASLRALLEGLRESGAAVTIEFARPLISGETTWTLPDESAGRRIGAVGGDFVCFSEPWNDTTRDRCTPIANIVSVVYTR
jgi:hypothetical protein